LASLDLSSWELAFNGSEPIQAETLKQFTSKFATCGVSYSAFYSCYGMAETTLLVSGGEKNQKPVVRSIQTVALEQNLVIESEIPQPESRELVGCGCPNKLDNKVIIVEPNSLTRLGKGQVGEIWISGQNVASGYWNLPQMTKETFQAYLTNTGEGPFLRTGDLGFLQDGELFVTGRLKDVIIIRGQNHYPQDLELTVENSHTALRKGFGAAFAIELNGSERLVIVQEIERNYLRKLDIKEIAASIREAVTVEHGLQVYATALLKTGSIPKTSSGKIQRHACKAGFINGNLNIVKDWSETPQGKVKFLHLQKEVDSMLVDLSNHYSK
ncbi:MAG: AMP-binding protein, partial [Waterburya sp.]